MNQLNRIKSNKKIIFCIQSKNSIDKMDFDEINKILANKSQIFSNKSKFLNLDIKYESLTMSPQAVLYGPLILRFCSLNVP
jgi:hypothetical protein